MKIGVYSNNVQVNTMLVSMVAQNGCKFTKMFRYSKSQLKGNDMVIIDLDNCSDGMPTLEEDIATMPEILFVGMTMKVNSLRILAGLNWIMQKSFS